MSMPNTNFKTTLSISLFSQLVDSYRTFLHGSQMKTDEVSAFLRSFKTFKTASLALEKKKIISELFSKI